MYIYMRERLILRNCGGCKCEACRVSTREELMLQLQTKGHLEAEFFPLGGPLVFFLLKPSTDWMRPTTVMFFPQSTDLNVSLHSMSAAASSRCLNK